MNIVIGKEQITLSGEQYDQLVKDIERLEQENSDLLSDKLANTEAFEKIMLEFKEAGVDIETRGNIRKPCNIRFASGFDATGKTKILIEEI